jgi:adenine-specific DNA methylase
VAVRHGHISTLHIWWARRPLAACRAVLRAALWPDPADENCPPSFRETAAQLMQEFAFTASKERSVAVLCHPVIWGNLSALRFGSTLVTLDQEQRERIAEALTARYPAEALAETA